MAKDLKMQIKSTGDGRRIAIINGKSYLLLCAYEHTYADGYFFLMVAGKTPLKADDLAEHWQVVRSGNVYIAADERLFAYHLALGEESEVPDGCDWTRLKARPTYFAFVGPTEDAVKEQVWLVAEQYNLGDAEWLLKGRGWTTQDECGNYPNAMLLQLS